MRVYDSILDTIGRTPLVRLDELVPEGPEVLGKVEMFNPGGSVKDRIGRSMIRKAEEEGDLKPGGTIVEGTSGNTGIGLAIAGQRMGYDVIFTMPDKMAVEKEKLLRAYGAEVLRCPTDVDPDDPESYYSVAERIAEERDNAVYPNQYFNEANPEAHYRTTGPEIWEDTDGEVTHFVAGVGTGGTISGTSRYLKEQDEDLVTVGVDPEGSILAHKHETGETAPEKAQPYLTEGIGEDLVPSTVWFDAIDQFVRTGDEECFEMARDMARELGILCGSSCGAALVGVDRAYRRGFIDDDATVVVLFPDTGERYLSSAYDESWLRGKGLIEPARTALGAAVTPLPRVPRDADLDALLRVATAREVPAVPVVEDDHVLGLVRLEHVHKDLLESAETREKAAAELAGAAPPSVQGDTALGEAANTLVKHDALIVEDEGAPAGLLTRERALEQMGRVG
jgi:cystathionine beta-synthase